MRPRETLGSGGGVGVRGVEGPKVVRRIDIALDPFPPSEYPCQGGRDCVVEHGRSPVTTLLLSPVDPTTPVSLVSTPVSSVSILVPRVPTPLSVK